MDFEHLTEEGKSQAWQIWQAVKSREKSKSTKEEKQEKKANLQGLLAFRRRPVNSCFGPGK